MKKFITYMNRALAAEKRLFSILCAILIVFGANAAPAKHARVSKSNKVQQSADVVPTDAELAKYYEQGNVCMCFFVPADMACNDIVVTGSFNGWSSQASECAAVQAVEGYDGWYVASFEPEAEPDESKGIQAKPIMLDIDGKLNWEYQVGSASVIRGGVQVVQGSYAGEVDLINLGTDAPNVFTVDSWKKNPCTAIYHNYTVTVVSKGCDGNVVPYIVGVMTGWDFQQMQLDEAKTQENGVPTYYTTFKAAEGSPYQIVSGLKDAEGVVPAEGDDAPGWKDIAYMQKLIDDAWWRIPGEDGDNQLTHEDANIVWDLRENNLRWARCDEAPETKSEIVFTAAVAVDDLPEDAIFTSDLQGFEAKIADAGNKMAIDANTCRFGTAEEYEKYSFRLKSGGASGSDKNFITLSVPADGKVGIAVRTANNSATDRALYVLQGTDTLFNNIIQESQAIEVLEDTIKVKVYPYVVVPVKAGDVVLRYSAALNFYAFGFLASEPLTIPTTAPETPKQAEEDVMAIYCNHYTINNANFGISGWAGPYQTLDLEGTNIGYWNSMTWECIVDLANMDAAHDFSAYENIHVDMWAPKAAKIKFTAESANNYKDGIKVDLAQGWNSIDIPLSEWPDSYDFKDLRLFVFEQYQTPAEESFEGNPFAFANIYFWKTPGASIITCKEAVDLMPAESGSETEKAYTVLGYVTNTNGTISRGQQTFWMDDVKGSQKTFQAYWCNLPEGETNPLNVGDKVSVTGKILNYNGTAEIKNGDVAILERATVQTDTIDASACEAIEAGVLLNVLDFSDDVYRVYGRLKDLDQVNNYGKHTFDIACTDNSAFKAYNCSGAEGLELSKGDSVVVIGKLYNYNGTIEISNGVVELIEKSEETIIEISAARALELAEGIQPGYMTTDIYDVVGYVSYIEEDAMSTYGNMTFWISSDPTSKAASNAEGGFYVYRAKPESSLRVGNKIKVRTHVHRTYTADSLSTIVHSTTGAKVTVDSEHVVLAFKFDGEICNDVVLVGTFNNWDPDSALVLMPLEGNEDWYVAEIPYDGATVQAKPVALKTDGQFSWDFQAGDADAWIHHGGLEAYFEAGVAYECNVYYSAPGAYVYEIAYWKNHANPCDVVTKDYTINLYAPQACDSAMIPAISGAFNNWKDFAPMTLGEDSLGRPVYTITVTADEHSEFKFGDVNLGWDNQILYYSLEYDEWYAFSNFVFGKESELTFDFSDKFLYRYTQCEPIDTVLCYYDIVMTDACNDGWDDNGQICIVDGSHMMYYRCDYRQSPARVHVPYYGHRVRLYWVQGSCTNENSITVYASNGEILFYHPQDQTMSEWELLYTMTESPCREGENPYIPQNIKAVVDSVAYTMTVSWDAVDSVEYYKLSIKQPDGYMWYTNLTTYEPQFTTEKVSQSGDYTIEVFAWRNNQPLGSAFQTQYIEVPPITSVHVSVLVPTDCEMDITDGVWIYWYTADIAKVEPMKALEGRRFEATFNPNAPSYNYSVMNKPSVYAENVQRTYEWTNLTTEEHCSEVGPFNGNAWTSLWPDEECAHVDHDYRPINDSVEIGEGIVTFHWTMVTIPERCYVLAYYYNASGYLESWSSSTIRPDSAICTASIRFSNDEPLEIAYWSVRCNTGYDWMNYGRLNGFVVPGNSLMPTNLLATPNEDNTYTLSWQRQGEAVYKLTAYGYDENGNYRDIAYEVLVEGDSYVTPDLSGLTSVSWYIGVFTTEGESVGSKYSEFYIRSPQDTRECPIHVYIPTAAGFASANGYTLDWNYSGLAATTVALESEGNNWYSAVLNVTDDYFYVAVRNGAAEDTTAISLAYEYTISEESYFVVSKDKIGKQWLRNLYSSACYLHDYVPVSLQAVPGEGQVTLKWSVNEQAPMYYVRIFDETQQSVWSSYVYADSCVATLSVDTLTPYTWYVIPNYANYSYYDYMTVYGDTFVVAPSPIIPTNLRATDNGDGTYTLEWDAPKRRVTSYYVDVYDPEGSYVASGYCEPSQKSYTTPVLPAFGRYTFTVHSYCYNDYAYTSSAFTVEPVETHDMTIRLLVHPDTGLENADGISLSRFDYNAGRWVACDTATSEGNHWFKYTLSSNSQGARIRFSWNNGNNSATYTISEGTCFEYYNSYVRIADCDAEPRDYRLKNVSVETQPGKAIFHWEMLTQPRYCYVGVSYRNAEGESITQTGDYIRQESSPYTYEFQFNNNEDLVVDQWILYFSDGQNTRTSEPQDGFRVEARDYEIEVSVVVPEGAPQNVEVIGSYDSWTGKPMAFNAAKNRWEATITAKYADEFKFREAGTWNNEIQYYDSIYDTWYNFPNLRISDYMYTYENRYIIECDYSDSSYYRWKVQSEPVVVEDSVLCYYDIVMTDYYNDGWNDGQICIVDGDHVMYYSCEYYASPARVHVPYYGHEARLYWVGESSTWQNSITVYASSGEGLFYHPQGQEMSDWQLLYTMTESPCRGDVNPYIPQNIKAVVDSVTRTMTVSWDALDSVEYYTLNIKHPEGYMWYTNAGTNEPKFTTDIVPQSGNYTIEVVAWRNNVPLGNAFHTQYIEVPSIKSVHVGVLVPSDCDMDISEGLWIYWYTNEGEHVEPMKALEGRRFEATFNPNATSYNYSVLNKSSLYAENVQRTYAWTDLVEEEHCSEVMRFTDGAEWSSLRYDDGCDNPDHDYRPHNTSVEVSEGTAKLHWELTTIPERCYAVIYYYDEQGTLHSRSDNYAYTTDTATYDYTFTFDNIKPFKVEYWKVSCYTANGWQVFGHEDGFTVPGNSILPTDLMATPNENNTYTLTWQRHGEAEYRLYVYGYTNDYSYNTVVYARLVEGESFTTPDMSDYVRATWQIEVFSTDGEYVGYQSSEFNIAHEQETRELAVRVYVPEAAGYQGEQYFLQWNYPGMQVAYTPLASEGNNWYNAVLEVAQNNINVAVRNADATDSTAVVLTYQYDVYDDIYLFVNKTKNGTLVLKQMYEEYYPHDYLPFNFKAQPGEGEVRLSWSTNEPAPYYRVYIYNEAGESVWYSNITETNCVASLAVDSATSFTWAVISGYADYSYDSNTIVYAEEAFTALPSSYRPLNLNAVDNGDATFTITWDAPQMADINYYEVYLYNPSGSYVTGAVCQEPTWTTPVLSVAGRYTYYVAVYGEHASDEAYSTFVLEQVETHDINVRLLVHPDSGLETADSISLRFYSYATDNWTECRATSEGEHWYAYTFSSTNPGARIRFSWNEGNNSRTFDIAESACFEFTGSTIQLADCDAVAHDYRPKNITAVINADNSMTVNWNAVEGAASYRVQIYTPDGYQWVNSRVDDHYFASSGVLQQNGTYTINVTSIDSYGNTMASSSITTDVELVNIGGVTVTVLVPSDCAMPVDSGMWINWFVQGDTVTHIEPMVALEGRRFTANFNVPAPSFGYVVLNRPDYNYEGVHYTYSFDGITESAHCAEVLWSDYEAHSINKVEDCQLVDHDYRAFNLKAVSIPGRVEFSWEAKDVAQYSYLYLTDINTGRRYYANLYNTTEFTYLVEDFLDSMQMQWSILPYQPYRVEETYADSIVMLHKSEVEISNIKLTTTDSVTLDLTWHSNREKVNFRIEVLYSGYMVKSVIVSDTIFHHTAQWPGEYEVNITPLSAENVEIGRTVYPGSINLENTPEPFANLKGEANVHQLTFSWETDIPKAYVEIYRARENGGYTFIDDMITSAKTFSYAVEEDGLYLLQIRPYIEYAPNEFSYIPYSMHVGATAFSDKETFAVQLTANEGGYVWPEGISGNYPAGYELNISAYSYDGYRFVGWSDGSEYWSRTIVIESDTTISAIFEPIPVYDITVQPAEGGHIYVYDYTDGTEQTDSVFHASRIEGSRVYIYAYADDGYIFSQWSDGVTTASRDIVISQDTMLTPIFIPHVRLTIPSVEGGEVLVSGDYITHTDSIYTFIPGASVELTALPLDSFRFTGWSDQVTTIKRTLTLDADITIKANFERITSEIHRYYLSVRSANNYKGTVNEVSGYYNEGDRIELVATPGTGYAFTGWSDDNKENPRLLVVTKDEDLIAQFDIKKVSIKIEAGEGGSVNDSTANGSYNYGTNVRIIATPDENNRFISWSDGNYEADRYIKLTEDTVLTAAFEINPIYTLAITAGEGGLIRATGVDEFAVNYTREFNEYEVAYLEAKANEGYSFYQWSDGNNNAVRSITMTKDVELNAIFQRLCRLTLTATEGGNVAFKGAYISLEDSTYTLTYGKDVILAATPADGYRFIGWSNGASDATLYLTVDGDIQITALFEKIPYYAFSVAAGEGGLIYVTGMTSYAASYRDTLVENTTLYVSAAPNSGYSFDKWSDGSTDATRVITLTSDSTLTATFRPLVHLTINVTGQGTVDVAGNYLDSLKGVYTAVNGTELTLTAVPADGYRFTGWSDQVAVVQRTITLDADLALTVTFEEAGTTPKYTINIGTEGSGAGSVNTNGGVYYEGDQIELTATPGYLSEFVGWSDGNTDNPRTLVVGSDSTINAIFALFQVNLTISAAEGGSVNDSVNGKHDIGSTVTIMATPEPHHFFTGWSDGSKSSIRELYLYQDSALVAYFESEKHTVTFLNYNGDTLESKLWVYGETPVCSVTPTRVMDDSLTYTFKGWEPEIVAVTEDAAYTAVFDAQPRLYTITFLNYNGDTLESKQWAYNEVPVCSVVPTRVMDDSLTYTFKGWEPEIVAVTADAAYTAVFDAQPRLYIITFLNYNGDTLESKQWAYNEVPVCSVTPTRAADDSLTYTFIGWEPEIVAVTEDAAYTAVYSAKRYVFTVTFFDWDNTVLSTQKVKKGEDATPPADPERAGYKFIGWDGNYTNVQHDESVYATYQELQAIDNVDAENAPRKVIIDGQIYILRGDKIYSIQGHKVE